MFDAVLVISGSNCNKTKNGGWGVSIYEISEVVQYDVSVDDNLKAKLVEGYYLSSFGVNRSWKVADKDTIDILNVLKVRELTEIFGASENPSSLAKAESLGFLEAIKFIDENHWRNVLIYCDSRYVAQNLNKLMKSRETNVLKRKDGKNIATYDEWSEITSIVLKLLTKGTVLKWKWIQDNLPKTLAERSKILAKKGQALAINKKDKFIEVHKDGRMFVPDNKCHGFLLQSRMYFIPAIINVTNDGRRYYYCGSHGEKDSWCGKPRSDSTVSVFILDELDPVLELIMGIKRSKGVNHNGQVIKLDNIKYSGVRNEIVTYDKDLMIYDEVTGNIENYIGKEFLLEQKPPYLFFRLFEKLNSLYSKLSDYISDTYSDETFYLDITDRIFTKTKKGKSVLNSQFITSKFIEVPIDKLNTKVTLSVGIELPPDIGLKRIALEDPKVRLYVEQVGPILYKYYVYIKTNKACGIFTTTDANSIILNSSK